MGFQPMKSTAHAQDGRATLDLPALAGYTNSMTSKEIAIKIISAWGCLTAQDLPDSVTWADMAWPSLIGIEERIRFVAAIDRGLADIKSGKIVPHKEVKESLKKWLSR